MKEVHYSKNKMDLFLEVLRRYINNVSSMQGLFEKKRGSCDLYETVCHFVEHIIDSHMDNSGLLREMLRMTLYSYEVRLLSEKVNEKNIHFIKEFIRNRFPVISDKEAGYLAWIVYCNSEGVIYQYTLKGVPISKARIVGKLSCISVSEMSSILPH